MSFIIGIDFCATSNFVTHQADCFPETDGFAVNNYPTTLSGAPTTSGYTINFNNLLDADAGIDPRLASFSYSSNDFITYRIDLPSAGQYVVNLGAGDNRGFNHPGHFEVRDSDDTTVLIDAHAGIPGTQFLDATGTVYASASGWVAANPIGGGGSGGVTVTVSNNGGTIAVFVHWRSDTFAGDSNACLCHFMIQSVAGDTLMGAMVM